MKKVAAVAVLLLGTLGNGANAESNLAEAPNLALALNGAVANPWIKVVPSVKTETLASKSDQAALEKAIEDINSKLEKELEMKIAQDLDYAIH